MTNLTCVAVDAANLTESQRDGLACIRCGVEADAMTPAGVAAGYGQVFQCSPVCADAETAQTIPTPRTPSTSAVTADCPAWCNPEHAHHFPFDVEHESGPCDLATSSLVEGDAFGDVCGGIYQQPGQAAYLSLSIHTDRDEAEVELTPEEALRVGYGLINKAMAARAAGSR